MKKNKTKLVKKSMNLYVIDCDKELLEDVVCFLLDNVDDMPYDYQSAVKDYIRDLDNAVGSMVPIEEYDPEQYVKDFQMEIEVSDND